MSQSSLGEAIKQLRIANQLTQTELGQGLVSASMISQIEANRVTPSHQLLQRLAERLSVDVEKLNENLHEKNTHLSWYRDAKCLYQAGSYARAIKHYSKLAEIRSPHFDLIDILLEYAECLTQVGQYQEAKQVYEKVYSESSLSGEPVQSLTSLSRIARMEAAAGNEQQAFYHLWRAYRIIETAPELSKKIKATILAQFARSCYQLFYLPDAEKLLLEAFHLAVEDHLQDDLPRILLGLGIVNKLLGKYEQALDYLNQALTVDEAIHYQQLLQVQLHKASVLANLGSFEESYELLQTCLSGFQQTGEARIIANCYSELSNWANLQARYEEAIQFSNEALTMISKDTWEAANIYQAMSSSYRGLGDIHTSLTLLTKAMKIFIHTGSLQSASRIALKLQTEYHKLQDYSASSQVGLELAQAMEASKPMLYVSIS